MSLYKRSKEKSSTSVEPNPSNKRQRQEDHAEIPSSSSSSILSYFPSTGKTPRQKLTAPTGATRNAKKASPPPATMVTPITPVSMSSTGAFTLSFGAPVVPKPPEIRREEVLPKHKPTPSKAPTRPISRPSQFKYDNPYTKSQASLRETELRVHGNTQVRGFGDAITAPVTAKSTVASHLPQSHLQSTSSSASTTHVVSTVVAPASTPQQHTQAPSVPTHKARTNTTPASTSTTVASFNRSSITTATPAASAAATATTAVATSAATIVAKKRQDTASTQLIAFLSPRLLQRLSVAANVYAPRPPSATTTASTTPTAAASAAGTGNATSTSSHITCVSTASTMASHESLSTLAHTPKPMLHARRVVLPVDVTSHPLLRTMSATFQLLTPVNTMNAAVRVTQAPSEAKTSQGLLATRQHFTEPGRKCASVNLLTRATNGEGSDQLTIVDAPQTTCDGGKNCDSSGTKGDDGIVLLQMYAELVANMPVADMILYTHAQTIHAIGAPSGTTTTAATSAAATASTTATPLPIGQLPRENALVSADMPFFHVLVENEDTLSIGPGLVAVKLVDDGAIAEMAGGSSRTVGVHTFPGFGYGYGADICEDVSESTGDGNGGENNRGNTTSRAMSKNKLGLRGGTGGKTRECRGSFLDSCGNYPLHSRSDIIEFCQRHRTGTLLAFLLSSPTALSLQRLATDSCGISASQVACAARLEHLPSLLMSIGKQARGTRGKTTRNDMLTDKVIKYIDEEVAEVFSSLAHAPSCLPRPWELSMPSLAHSLPQPPVARRSVRNRVSTDIGAYAAGVGDKHASGDDTGVSLGVSLCDLATMDIDHILHSTSLNKEDATLLRGWIRGEVADSEWIGVVEP